MLLQPRRRRVSFAALGKAPVLHLARSMCSAVVLQMVPVLERAAALVASLQLRIFGNVGTG